MPWWLWLLTGAIGGAAFGYMIGGTLMCAIDREQINKLCFTISAFLNSTERYCDDVNLQHMRKYAINCLKEVK